MKKTPTVGEILQAKGVSRRGFLKYSATTPSILALPPSMIPRIAEAIESARRPSVILLSFQECTGCTESLTRSASPTVEGLIFDAISLDYHHTLQAAAGDQAEAARHAAMEENDGSYLVLVDGSIPLGNPGFSTIAGISNVEMLRETVAGAAAVVAIGSCAAFGGIPGAENNWAFTLVVAVLIAIGLLVWFKEIKMNCVSTCTWHHQQSHGLSMHWCTKGI